MKKNFLLLACILGATSSVFGQRDEARPLLAVSPYMHWMPKNGLAIGGQVYAGVRKSWLTVGAFYDAGRIVDGPRYQLIGPFAEYRITDYPERNFKPIARCSVGASLASPDRGKAVNQSYGLLNVQAENTLGVHQRVEMYVEIAVGTDYRIDHFRFSMGSGFPIYWMSYTDAIGNKQGKIIPSLSAWVSVTYEIFKEGKY